MAVPVTTPTMVTVAVNPTAGKHPLTMSFTHDPTTDNINRHHLSSEDEDAPMAPPALTMVAVATAAVGTTPNVDDSSDDSSDSNFFSSPTAF